MNSNRTSPANILFTIVDKKQRFRFLAGHCDGALEDSRIGFHPTDLKRKHLVSEIIEYGISLGNECRMRFIGIGNENERIAALQTRQHIFRNEEAGIKHGAPCGS